MSYTTVKDQLLATLEAVDGVVNAYGYFRYARRLDERDAKFVDEDTNQLHTWMLTRASAPSKGALDGDITRSHVFQAHGYREIVDTDESEIVFQELTESILNAFNDARTIDEDAAIMDSAQLLAFENVMFCGVLCHHAVIEITVEDDVDP